MFTLIDVYNKDVVYEKYDDEMIFLNLKQGYYYTLSQPGADCAEVLLLSNSVDEALRHLQAMFDTDEQTMVDYCQALIDELTREDLLKDRPGKDDNVQSVSFPDKPRELKPYTIEKYEDIQDILKFDPVHEVSDEGWPEIASG